MDYSGGARRYVYFLCLHERLHHTARLDDDLRQM
jgi:hypothetical protein